MPGTQIRESGSRGETINLRASRQQKAIIDQAAQALGRSRSDFMLDIVCREAESVLLDRRYFAVPADDFERFSLMLDKPPSENPKLRRLLERRPLWEK
jgi:uncharacterized protein (DUF1778 family)